MKITLDLLQACGVNKMLIKQRQITNGDDNRAWDTY
jgi:hypothetical protein